MKHIKEIHFNPKRITEVIRGSNSLPMLKKYYQFLKEGNEQFGLFSKGDSQRILQRHLLDSILPALLKDEWPSFQKAKNLGDFGSGPGLPGIPLALLLNKPVSLFEVQKRRVAFIDQYTDTIIQEYSKINSDKISQVRAANFPSLKKVEVVSQRLEDPKQVQKYKNSIHLGVSRAFLNLGISLELVAPYIVTGGLYIFYAGETERTGIMEIEPKLKPLGFTLKDIYKINGVPYAKNRSFLVFKKTELHSANLPRNFAQMKKEWDTPWLKQ